MLALALSATGPSAIPAGCLFDRDALISLDYRSFDQDPGGGWRALAGKGCDKEAADLIRDWRERHDDSRYILFWHEGQSRAFGGDYRAAIGLFERSRRPAGEDRIGWNFYVDGSVAFLEGNLLKLRAARARLAQMPKPPEWEAMRGVDGKMLNATWPVNLNVLDGFIRCWGKRYREAYGCDSAPPNRTE
jgi:hypothetical protein